MRIDRLTYEPGAALDFYEKALTGLGVLCERTWYDRLEVIAEGRAAMLWNTNGALHSDELHFAAADTSGARDVVKDIFPGCPLTFRLAEALRPAPLPLERLVLADETHPHPPDSALAERRWRAQFPDTTRWRLATPFGADYHFSLVILARCEIQAIDQHWSLHRLAMSLPGGGFDESLGRDIAFAQPVTESNANIGWPAPNPVRWKEMIGHAVAVELEDQLSGIRRRQENSLRRELDRIDDYFEHYASDLAARGSRSTRGEAKLKNVERLAAAKAEHARQRSDQVNRHEIRVCPHIDALLLVAEPAWRASMHIERSHQQETTDALYVTRSRRWEL